MGKIYYLMGKSASGKDHIYEHLIQETALDLKPFVLYTTRPIRSGEQAMVPLYVEVDDGLRLSRALERERKQTEPKYAEMCRRFLADCEDFTEEKIAEAGIVRRFSNNSTPEDCFSEIQNFVEQQKKL